MTAPCPTCGGGGSVREGTKRDDTPWIDCPDCHDGYVTEAEARRILAKRTERGSWGTTPLARRLDHFGLTPAEADALADVSDDDAAARDDREDRLDATRTAYPPAVDCPECHGHGVIPTMDHGRAVNNPCGCVTA